MKQIFLAPRSNETAYKNYQSTLANGVAREKVLPYLSQKEQNELETYSTYFIWGSQPSVKNKWEKMLIGDYILFYKDGHFIQSGEVFFKTYNSELALELWPKSSETGEPWACLYFVKNLKKTNLPLKEFNKIADYNLKAVMGFQRISEDHINIIKDKFGSIEHFVESLSLGLNSYEAIKLETFSLKDSDDLSYAEIEIFDSITRDRDPDEVLAELSLRNIDKKPEEIEVKQKRIKRDYKLVQTLKEKYQYKCQICGFTFKTKAGNYYCEAAHIKPISGRSKGLDVAENMMVLCPNHHKMLDHGELNLDEYQNIF